MPHCVVLPAVWALVPDLAAEQLTAALRDLGLRGAMISTQVEGTDRAGP
jgi:hypothetical protein